VRSTEKSAREDPREYVVKPLAFTGGVETTERGAKKILSEYSGACVYGSSVVKGLIIWF
jgi:hypothetical protein